jgi:hypothetical protein
MSISFAPVPFAPSSLSNSELERLIRNQYPNLQGALRVLVERFSAQLGVEHGYRVPQPNCCTHCGAEYTLGDTP